MPQIHHLTLSTRKYYQDAIDIFQSNIGLGMFVYPEIDQLRMAIENQKTRRERPKSAPYLRLKNIQGTTIVKIWKKKFFKKIIFEIFFRKKSIF